MRYSHRLFISWLMILIMFIGPVQVTFAGNLEPDNPAQNCQFLSIQTSESGTSISSEQVTVSHCQGHTVCVSHINCVTFLTSKLFEFSTPVLMLAQDLASKVTVSTRYPRLLKRPPKS
jgi:hypothetical protein